MNESRSKKDEVIAYALERCKLGETDKPRVLMIGDRFHDIEGAKKNGLKSCVKEKKATILKSSSSLLL